MWQKWFFFSSRPLSDNHVSTHTESSWNPLWESCARACVHLPSSIILYMPWNSYQTVQCVSFSRMPSGERTHGDVKKPRHSTWKQRPCEGTGVNPLNEPPPAEMEPEHKRAAAHPSLLICRRPYRPSIHTALWFHTVSLFFFLYICYLHKTPGTPALKGETRASHLSSAAWIRQSASLYTYLLERA